MSDAVDVVVLSPHLDDATFSCGATLHAWASQGRKVLVATPFAGSGSGEASGLELELHELWGFSTRAQAVAARRAEDELAAARLGVLRRHGDLPDAVYRRGPASEVLYPDLSSVRGPVAALDDIALELGAFVDRLPPAARLLAPLAIGGHVDHRLVRAAAREVEAEVLFYEDFPYARSISARLKATFPSLRWRSRVAELPAASLEAKLEAARCYRSQAVGPLADGGLEEALVSYFRRRGGERLWWQRP